MNVAVYAGSKELYPFMLGSIKSMLKNGGADKVYMIIEDDEYIQKLPPEVEVINFKNQKFFRPDGPNMKQRFTYMTLARSVLTKLLPQDLDKVLSMDCDTVVMGSLEEVWERDLDGYYFAATREPYLCRWDSTYHNTGVAYYNLKKLREDGIDDKIIHALNTKQYKLPEQDTYNEFCQGHILDMPSEFNYNDYVAKPFEEVRVRHYAGHGVHIWGYLPDMQHYINMTWEEVFRNRKRSST